MATGVALNGAVRYKDGEAFVMNKSVNIPVSALFSKNGEEFLFNHENSVLDLSCLNGLRLKKEKFLPAQIFVLPTLQTALKYRLVNNETTTVVFGSPGVGKSVFCFFDRQNIMVLAEYSRGPRETI